jgi:hypothetical protein
MKLAYNQRNFLRLVLAALHGRYFASRGVLREIDWEARTEVDEINAALTCYTTIATKASSSGRSQRLCHRPPDRGRFPLAHRTR